MLINQATLNRALAAVTRELDENFFWTRKVARYEVILEPVAFTYLGICHSREKILIPALSFIRLRDWISDSAACSLRDILRHEFAHALHFSHPRFIMDAEFRDTFLNEEYDQTRFVSEYAAIEPCEDFAETFTYYLKHGGMLPTRMKTRTIRRKWRFIERLSRRCGRAPL
jgi:hypothetical protein